MCFSQRSETQTPRLQTGENEVERWWEPGVVGVASAKHALPFGARPALARTDGRGPFSANSALGRPPERREVETAAPKARTSLWPLKLFLPAQLKQP